MRFDKHCCAIPPHGPPHSPASGRILLVRIPVQICLPLDDEHIRCARTPIVVTGRPDSVTAPTPTAVRAFTLRGTEVSTGRQALGR